MRQPAQANLKKLQDINNIEKEKEKAKFKGKKKGKDRNGKDKWASPNGKGSLAELDPNICGYCREACGKWYNDCEKRKADIAAGTEKGKGKTPTWKGKPGSFNKDAAVNTLEQSASSTAASSSKTEQK